MEWKSVKDHPPEINGPDVLVTDGEKCWVASRWKFDHKDDIYFTPTIGLCILEFTIPVKWMPLPKLPHEFKNGSM